MLLPSAIDDFQAQVSRSIYVDRDDAGQHYIATPFAFDDGDEPVLALIEDSGNRLLLSDLGNTLFRMDYEGLYASQSIQQELNRTLADAGISRHNDELTKPLPFGQYAETVLDFVHTLLTIDKLGSAIPVSAHAKTPRPAPNVGAASKPNHKDAVYHLVQECLPAHAVKRNWRDARNDPDRAYPVDFKISGGDAPLFLHAPIGNASVQSAIIASYRLNSLEIRGRHAAVLRDGSSIAKKTLIQLGDACETIFRDLEEERSAIKEFLRAAVAG